MKKPVEVGAKLRVRGRFEEFSGIVRYCRSEDWDYLVGMQRVAAVTPTEKQAAVQDQPSLQEGTPSKVLEAKPATEPSPPSAWRGAPRLPLCGETRNGLRGWAGDSGPSQESSSTA